MKKLTKKETAQLVKIQALLADHLGVSISPEVALQFKKDFEAREALSVAAPVVAAEKPKKAPAAKKKAWNSPEERLVFLAKARDEHFKKMGFGPYAPKAAPSAPKKSKAEKDAALAIARDEYFKQNGYGKYKPATTADIANEIRSDAIASALISKMTLILGGKKQA